MNILSPLCALSYMDARLHKEAPADGTSAGRFTCVTSKTVTTMPVSANKSALFIYTWTSSSNGLVAQYNNDVVAGTDAAMGGIFRQQLSTAGSFHSIRALRATIVINNLTPMLTASGRAHVLCAPVNFDLTYNTGTDGKLTGASITQLIAWATNDTDSRMFTGTELLKEKSFVLPVASNVGYHKWLQTWASSNTLIDNDQAILTAQDDDRLFSFMVYFTGFSSDATFQIETYTQDGIRATTGTPLASLATTPDYAPEAVVTHLHQTLARSSPSLSSVVPNPQVASAVHQALTKATPGVRLAPVDAYGGVERPDLSSVYTPRNPYLPKQKRS